MNERTIGASTRAPAYAPAENVAVRSTEITVTAAGGALISKHTTLQGPLHEWYRDAADQLTPDELKKALQKQNPLPQAYCTRLSVRPDKAAPKAYIEYDLEVPQFGSKAGKRLFLPANPVNAFTDVPPANDQRVHPVEIRAGHIEQDTIVFRYPESYSVESIPAEHTAIETEFGTYSNRVVRQEADRAILFIRRLEMKAVLLPAARYTEWRNFCRDVAKADAMKVVLIQKT